MLSCHHVHVHVGLHEHTYNVVDVMLHFLHVEEVLLFFKFYDPTSRTISFIGHSVENIEKKFSEWFLHFSSHVIHVSHHTHMHVHTQTYTH